MSEKCNVLVKAPPTQETDMPRELPMPRYDYQVPQPGSFELRFNDADPREPLLPILQNLRLSL